MTTTAAVHLLSDNIIRPQENMNRYKFIKEEMKNNVEILFSGLGINECKEYLRQGILQTFRRLCDPRINLQNMYFA